MIGVLQNARTRSELPGYLEAPLADLLPHLQEAAASRRNL
jgi:hypothetical protein